MQTKRCTKCGETKALGEYASHKGMADGHRPDCRACISAYNKAYRAANPERTKARRKAEYQRDRERILNERRKPCVGCGGTKAPGARRYCASCKAVAEERRRERERQAARAWKAANPERRAAAERAWKQANPERFAAAVKAWREANPDRDKANRDRNRKRWRTENPDRTRELALRYATRKRAAFVEDVNPLVVLERADGVCGVCGGDVDPLRFDVDHIVPLARGGEHSYRNTQPAHPSCNYRKGAQAP
jgi:5-methylcytosine-specific restriction endonuclease McrA